MSARRGGITTYTRNLIDSLAARHIDTVVAVPPGLHQERPNTTISVRASEFGPVKRLLWEQTIWRNYVRQHAPDMLFSSANFGLFWSPVPQLLLLREGGLFDSFYLTNIAPTQGVRSAAIRALRRRLMLISAHYADQIVVPSESMRDALLCWSPKLAAKCHVNLYGTLNDIYRPEERTRPWRADGVLKLLYVSVYYPHKNPGLVCEAVRQLNERGIRAHATVTMDLEDIRRTSGGALDYSQMKEAVRRGEISLGSRSYSSLPTLYREHDVFVFPSVSETFGHPMAEALSSGLYLIAADTAITREICGDSALYFRPFSATELCDRLIDLDHDPALRGRMAERARERAVSLFKWSDHVDRLVDLFHSLVEQRKRRARVL
jgi:glycosyltransferase involved in cell wall biosynthesis